MPFGRPTRWSSRVVFALCTALFLVGPGVAVPWSVLILGPLLALCWWAAGAPRGDHVAQFTFMLDADRPPIGRLVRLLWLGLLPLIAAGAYAVARPIGSDGAQFFVALPQTIAGYAVFGWAVGSSVQARRLGTRVI